MELLVTERLEPLPDLSELLVWKMVFSTIAASRKCSVRDLSKHNFAYRSVTGMGSVVFVDLNSWAPHDHVPHFPNKERAKGLWSTIRGFSQELLDVIQSLVGCSHNNLNQLTEECYVTAMGRLPVRTGQ